MENNMITPKAPKSNFDFTDYPVSKLKAMAELMKLEHLTKGEYTSFDVFVSKILRNEILEAIEYQLNVRKLSDCKPSGFDFTDGLEYEVDKDIYPCKLLEWSGIGPKERNVYFDNMDLLNEQFSEWETYQKMQQQARQQAAQQQQSQQQQSQPAGCPLYNNTNHQQQAAAQPFSNGAGQQMNNGSAPIYNNAINLINSIFSNPLMKKDFMDLISKYTTVPAQQQQFINIGHGQCTVPMKDVLNGNLYGNPQYEQIPEEPVLNQEEQNPSKITEEQEQQVVPNQEEQQMPSEEPLQEAVTLFPEVEAETFSLSNKEIEENAQNFKKIYSNYNSISKDARNGVKAPLAAFCQLLEVEKEKGVDTDSYNFKIMNPKKLSEDQIIFKDFNNHITGMVVKNPDGSYLPTITPDTVQV